MNLSKYIFFGDLPLFSLVLGCLFLTISIYFASYLVTSFEELTTTIDITRVINCFLFFYDKSSA